MAKVESREKSASVETLAQICLKTTVHHLFVLGDRITDLPATVLDDLLLELNILDLERIESVLQSKGLTALHVWESLYEDLWPVRRRFYGSPGVDQPNWKMKTLERLFHVALYTQKWVDKKYLSGLSEQAVLAHTGPHVQSLWIIPAKLRRLASDDLKPILSVLERGVRCLRFLDHRTPWTGMEHDLVYVLHRLLDHGPVKEVEIGRCYGSDLQRWVTARCRRRGLVNCLLPVAGPRAEEGEWQLSRFTEYLFTSPTYRGCCDVVCEMGEIESLVMQVTPLEIISVVSPTLPYWDSLHTLHLHTEESIQDSKLLLLVDSLQALCSAPGCCLKDLRVGVNHLTPVNAVLEACHSLTSLSLDIFPAVGGSSANLFPNRGSNCCDKLTEFALEKLYVRSYKGNLPLDTEGLLSVLRQAPHLSLLHLSGIHMNAHKVAPVLNTVAEFNKSLKCLLLEDVYLGSCHDEILHLLKNSNLQELCFKDGLLLDQCPNEEDFLKAFVTSIKGVSTLESLALPGNRLASNMKHLAELFSEHNPSTIMKLDLSCNFLEPADLLEFVARLRPHERSLLPTRKPLLDLGLNMLDEDKRAKHEALMKLRPLFHVVTDNWEEWRIKIVPRNPIWPPQQP